MLDFASTRLGRQFLVDVHKIALSLERLADAAERLAPPDGEREERKGGDDG